jgi:hypothetical protein
MAQRGVQDREILVEDAVRFVTANYERPSDRQVKFESCRILIFA